MLRSICTGIASTATGSETNPTTAMAHAPREDLSITAFKHGIKRDPNAYPVLKNEAHMES